MLLLDRLAEEQIKAALRRGDLDNLPGTGRPLELEDESAVPEELRAAYRLLKNAGCVPPEFILRNEILQLEGLLMQVETDAECENLRRRLSLLKARLALGGRELNLLIEEGAYRKKLLSHLQRAEDTALRCG